MNHELADKIARATLYEGYILYPYRPSVKNHQRWTFGGVYPKAWGESRNNYDPYSVRTEVLVAGDGKASLRVITRFLHLVDRTVGAFPTPLTEVPAGQIPEYRLVESLDAGGIVHRPWQEAVEREFDAGEFDLEALALNPAHIHFAFPENTSTENLASINGTIAGVLVRRQLAIEGAIDISAARIVDDLWKVSVVVQNRTKLDNVGISSRDDALMRSLVSMHALLGVQQGDFVSLTDAPDQWQASTAECHNTGLWPVLIGTGVEHDTMLASPIILYDYPQLAPESPGDLFDSTEIDEILTLRILTLTDEEKLAASSVDPRARELLARTESLARDQLSRLHGSMREFSSSPQEQSHG